MQVANINAKEVALGVRVVKADGTIIEYGVVDYWHRNPLKRFIWNLKKFLRRT